MWSNKNNQIKVKTLNNSKYNYDKEAEVIHGNAATGEQYSLKRNIYSEVPITPELMEKYWDEMDREVESLRKRHPGQAISATSYQDTGGKQIIKFTPTTELIFPSGVPIFDEKGNQIIGKDNVRVEVERRREEWVRWEKEGKLSEHVEIHHTDDGKTVRIKFRAAPKRVHPNEIRGETEWFINNETQRWESKQNRIGGTENNQELSEGTLRSDSNKAADGNNKSKKPKVEENTTRSFSNETSFQHVPNTVPMEVDKPENLSENPNSPKGTSFELLPDDKLEKASKSQLVDLIKRTKKELEIRRKIEEDSNSSSQTGNYQVSTQELKDKLQKYENALNSRTSNTTDLNNDDKSSNVGGIVAAFGVVSVLVIGSVAFVKSKLGKNKKK